MIKKDPMTINGKVYIRTWSDTNMMIERDGALYEEAIDPAELGRVYTETDTEIVHENMEATEEDYLAALERFGVHD